MSEVQSNKSLINIKDNNNPSLNKNISIVPNQQSIKMEVLQFKDEVLRELKYLKKSISEKYDSNVLLVSEKLNSYDNKIIYLNDRITELSENINTDNNMKKDISSLIEYKNKTRDNLLTIEIKMNNLEKEIKNNVFRIDNILSDSVVYPGIIGKTCKFKNFHHMLDHLLSQTSQTITYREKNTLDLNTYKKKLESLVQNLQSQKDNIIDQNNSMINKKMNEFEKKFKSMISLYDERLAGTRAENAEYIKNFQETVSKCKNELTEFEKLKGKIFEEIKEEGKLLRAENEKTQNIFLGYKKEFNLLKDRFTQLSEFIKDVRFRINMGQEVKRREYYQMSNRIDFSKKQKLDKDGQIIDNDINNELIEEMNNIKRKSLFFDNEITNIITKDKHYSLDNSKLIKMSIISPNNINNNIIINKSGGVENNKNKINKTNGKGQQTNNLSSIESDSNDKNLIDFNQENKIDNKNKINEINNYKKIEAKKINTINKGEEKEKITNNNNNEKKRKSISVRSIMEDSRAIKNNNIKNDINKKNLEKEDKNNINKDKKNIEMNNNNTKIKIINQNINEENINNLNSMTNKTDIENNFDDFKETSNNINNNNNNDINNNNQGVLNEYTNNLINKKDIQNSKNNAKLPQKIFNGLMNNKEENIKNEIEISTPEYKIINLSNNNSANNLLNNLNVIESKKNSKIYSQKIIKNNTSTRTKSALHSRFPNINNNNNNNSNIVDKKQQTLRVSSSSNDFINYTKKANDIMINSSDKNIIIFSKGNNHIPSYEEDKTIKVYNNNRKNNNINNNKKSKNINSEIFYVTNNAKFRANKIRTHLSPNVQILQYGVQQSNNNRLDKQRYQIGNFNKKYYNMGSNKKSMLNNTEYNFYKNKTISDKNEAKELQGMINNLQNYIKGYDSNFIKKDELKEERKKIMKNSSYFLIKEIVNNTHESEYKKNNDNKNSKKKNIVEIGFNNYK